MENFWQNDYIVDESKINYHIKLFIFIILLLLILLLIPIKHYKTFTGYNTGNIIYLNISSNDFTYLENKKIYIKNKSYNFDIIKYKDNIVTLKINKTIKDSIFKAVLKKNKIRTISFILGRG